MGRASKNPGFRLVFEPRRASEIAIEAVWDTLLLPIRILMLARQMFFDLTQFDLQLSDTHVY